MIVDVIVPCGGGKDTFVRLYNSIKKQRFDGIIRIISVCQDDRQLAAWLASNRDENLIPIFNRQNSYPPRPYNDGFMVSNILYPKSDFIQIMDDDFELRIDNFFEIMLSFYNNKGGNVVVASEHCVYPNHVGDNDKPVSGCGSGCLFSSRECFDKVGFMDESFQYRAFDPFFIRCMNANGVKTYAVKGSQKFAHHFGMVATKKQGVKVGGFDISDNLLLDHKSRMLSDIGFSRDIIKMDRDIVNDSTFFDKGKWCKDRKKISIAFPTFRGLDETKLLLMSIDRNRGNFSSFRVVIVVDGEIDTYESLSDFVREFSFEIILILSKENIECQKATAKAVKNSDAEIIFYLNDDMEVITSNFLEKVYERFWNRFKDGKGVYVFNDCIQCGRVAVVGAFTMRYVGECQFYDPEYIHYFCDTEIGIVSKRLGLFHYDNEICIRHNWKGDIGKIDHNRKFSHDNSIMCKILKERWGINPPYIT